MKLEKKEEGKTEIVAKRANKFTNKCFSAQDVNEIIKLLSSQSWTENKDGMTSLQFYLQGTRKLR